MNETIKKNTVKKSRKPAPQKEVRFDDFKDELLKQLDLEVISLKNNATKKSKKVQQKPAAKPAPKKSAPKNTAQTKPAPKKQTKTPAKKPVAKPAPKPTEKLRVIPLGGIDEVGKNMTLLEYGNDVIVIDAGLTFPGADMPGVDLVIPDFTYLEAKKDKLRAILFTHGHEDHIGAVPYILKKISVPLYGTDLTLGIIGNKLDEHKLRSSAKMNVIKAGDTVKLGAFSCEFIHTNHSIPGSVAIAVTTPVGTVIFTGDFKIDSTPIASDMIDLGRLGEHGRKGVLALFSDSTNAERPGYSMSEKIVGETFRNLFKNTDKRIIVATFSSNIYRVQQIVDAAVANGRKIAISGRSMISNVGTAAELGLLDIPDGTLIDINQIARYTNDKIVIITTGSQGEPMAALSRMAIGEHKKVEIGKDDMVIISATPIPGNEKSVSKVVNDLLKQGAEVIYERLRDIHVSGHACQEELKMMIALVKPKFFVPIHGEYKQLAKHAGLAKAIGYTDENIITLALGNVLEFTPDSARINGQVQSGVVLIDGLGIGDVGNIVLRDRKRLSEDGLLTVVVAINGRSGEVVSGPDIVSRGFVYVRESEEIMEGAKATVKSVVARYESGYKGDWGAMKNDIRDELSDYIFAKTRRSPMILPIIMDV